MRWFYISAARPNLKTQRRTTKEQHKGAGKAMGFFQNASIQLSFQLPLNKRAQFHQRYY